jgi:hypothetical protein
MSAAIRHLCGTGAPAGWRVPEKCRPRGSGRGAVAQPLAFNRNLRRRAGYEDDDGIGESVPAPAQ